MNMNHRHCVWENVTSRRPRCGGISKENYSPEFLLQSSSSPSIKLIRGFKLKFGLMIDFSKFVYLILSEFGRMLFVYGGLIMFVTLEA